MHDGETQAPCRLEYAARLANRTFEIVHVLEGHERNNEVEGLVVERQVRSVGLMRLEVWISLGRRRQHRRRPVDCRDVVTHRPQVARETPLAAAEIESPPARWGQQIEELIAMEAPVAVVIRLPRPRDELRCVLLPSGGEIRG